MAHFQVNFIKQFASCFFWCLYQILLSEFLSYYCLHNILPRILHIITQKCWYSMQILCYSYSAQQLDLFAWCVRLIRLLVGFRTHFKSLHIHSFIHSDKLMVMVNSKNLHVFIFVILLKSWKFDVCDIDVYYSNSNKNGTVFAMCYLYR